MFFMTYHLLIPMNYSCPQTQMNVRCLAQKFVKMVIVQTFTPHITATVTVAITMTTSVWSVLVSPVLMHCRFKSHSIPKHIWLWILSKHVFWICALDDDECKEDNPCENGECVNTAGSYNCFCTPPLILDDTQRRCISANSTEGNANRKKIYLNIYWLAITFKPLTCKIHYNDYTWDLMTLTSQK